MTLLRDMHRMGPAPTWEREMAAAAVNVVLLVAFAGVMVFGLGSRAAAAVVLVIGLGHAAGRLVVAARRRSGVSR